jgi:hypothetical protein
MYQGSSYHVVRTQLGNFLPFPIFAPPIHVGLQRRLPQHDAHVRISGVNIHFPVDLHLVVAWWERYGYNPNLERYGYNPNERINFNVLHEMMVSRESVLLYRAWLVCFRHACSFQH